MKYKVTFTTPYLRQKNKSARSVLEVDGPMELALSLFRIKSPENGKFEVIKIEKLPE